MMTDREAAPQTVDRRNTHVTLIIAALVTLCNSQLQSSFRCEILK